MPGESGIFVIDRGLDYPDSDDLDLLPDIGSAVVTAGESSYPADIPIGIVLSAERSGDEASMEVRVELSNNVDDLHFVTILLVGPTEDFPLGTVDAGVPAAPPAEESTDDSTSGDDE